MISGYHAQIKRTLPLGEVVESQIGADKVYKEPWASISGGQEAPTKDGAVSKNQELTRKLPGVNAEIILSNKV